MPGLPVGTYLQVTLNYRSAQQKLMNVLHYKVIASGTLNPFDDVDDINNWFADTATVGRPGTQIIALTPSNVTYHSVRTQVIRPVREAYREKAVVVDGARGPTIGPDLDVVITKRTDRTGRFAQGGFFLPGVSPDDAVNGLLIEAFQTEVDARMQWLKGDIFTAGTACQIRPVIFHQTSGDGDRITNILVQPEVRVMNRRQVGRGI